MTELARHSSENTCVIYSHYSPCPFGALMVTLSGAQSRAQSAFAQFHRNAFRPMTINSMFIKRAPGACNHLSHTITPLPPVENFPTVIDLSIVQ